MKLRSAWLSGIFWGALTMLVSTGAAWLVYQQARENYFRSIQENLKQMAIAAAANINGDLHAELTHADQMGSELHKKTIEPLLRLHLGVPDYTYMFSFFRSAEGLRFVLDTAQFKEKFTAERAAQMDPGTIGELWDVVLDEERTRLFNGLFLGYSGATEKPYRDSYGTFMAGYAPIRNSKHEVVGGLGVELDLKNFEKRFNGVDHAMSTGVLFIFAMSCLIGIAAWELRRRVNKQFEEIVEARHDAESANRSKSEFLAMMSHEIRTPMNAVIGFSELIADGPLQQEQREHLHTIQASGKILLNLINDILDLSKIESGQFELASEVFELRPTLLQVQELVSPEAEKKNISLSIEVDPKAPIALRGDSYRLSQILLNLLGNAVKFTNRGSVRLSVHCKLGKSVQTKFVSDDELMLRFEVRDTGIGIPAHRLNRIFLPFSQADSSTTRQYGGTGLGLTISRRLVNKMGGDIEVQSELGKGSTFSFEIPCQDPQLSSSKNEEPIRLESFGSVAGKLRILVVEDNPVNQELIRLLLEKLGFKPKLVDSGERALELVKNEEFHLILMDIQMPDLDGNETSARIRALEAHLKRRPCRIVALTANVMANDRQRCLVHGMDGFLSKPIQIAELKRELALTLSSKTPAKAISHS